MQSQPENHLYEYAVVRYVPRVEREEFINVGLVMMCKRRRWLRVKLNCDNRRIAALWKDADIDTLNRQLKSFTDIAEGKGCSPVAQFETHERFRWLTAVRSASIATSRPHPGLTSDLDATFQRLYSELIE
ncbi:MAG: DUF3037 domain-containing protein [Duncaniella sp.]|nr:DUF3037 domain-containing protein [Muribaculum sp.]MCM1254664.1 DUF3037 domain-containing protein [Duncaniella sp.]